MVISHTNWKSPTADGDSFHFIHRISVRIRHEEGYRISYIDRAGDSAGIEKRSIQINVEICHFKSKIFKLFFYVKK